MSGELFDGVVRRKPDRRTRIALRPENWPAIDRALWSAAFRTGELFDESGPGAHLRPRTRISLINACGRWLAFLAKNDPVALVAPPAQRLTRERIAAFCLELAQTNTGISIASLLRHLRQAVRLMEPAAQCEVVLMIAKQIEARFHARQKYPRLRTLLELHGLALKLMDEVEAAIDRNGSVTSHAALSYRDGLIIGLLVEAPMRRSNVAALRLGHQLMRVGSDWTIVLRAEDMKNDRETECPLSEPLSRRLDRYLAVVRPAFPSSDSHVGLWPSMKRGPMSDCAIYDAVCRRTREEFGTPMNLHLFRDAAVTFWADAAPDQFHLARDLLGHADLRTTEQHYRHAQTIRAARTLASLLETQRAV
jgi:integrase